MKGRFDDNWFIRAVLIRSLHNRKQGGKRQESAAEKSVAAVAEMESPAKKVRKGNGGEKLPLQSKQDQVAPDPHRVTPSLLLGLESMGEDDNEPLKRDLDRGDVVSALLITRLSLVLSLAGNLTLLTVP